MESEDEPGTYLKLFNEGTQSYLLHTIEDGLGDVFQAESVFTEIPSEWPADGLPILLSTPYINEEENENSAPSDVRKSPDEQTDNRDVILSNDLLFQVQTTNNPPENVNTAINCDKNSTDEVIQLLNIDGSVTTINKNLLNVATHEDYTKFFDEVPAKKCKFCTFLALTEDEIISHLKENHKKETFQPQMKTTRMTSILSNNQTKDKYTLYLCSTCGSGYMDKEDLKQHMIMNHKMTPITNGEPSQTVAPKSKAKTVALALLKKQKLMRKFKCPVQGCPHKFDKQESCKMHAQCHIELDHQKKRFMCTVCKVKFSLWRLCSMHMWKKHSVDLGLLTCPMCSKFKSYSAVKITNHMNIHREEKPFICASCGKGFKQMGQLRNHELIHKPSEPSQEIKCEACQRLFSSNKTLKKHIKFVHDKFKPFICNICGHQSSRKEMLQSHYRQHTGDKPFHCSYCEFKTADRNCLRKHMMRHFGMVSYACPYCDYKSIQSVSYKKHLASKHPGKEGAYKCGTCSFSTVNQTTYLTHVRVHELENNKQESKLEKVVEDSETKSSDEVTTFLTEHSEDTVDTGGITIPAEFDLHLPNDEISLM